MWNSLYTKSIFIRPISHQSTLWKNNNYFPNTFSQQNDVNDNWEIEKLNESVQKQQSWRYTLHFCILVYLGTGRIHRLVLTFVDSLVS